MATILIRNLPAGIHDALRRLAADRHVSVESLAREALDQFVGTAPPRRHRLHQTRSG